MDKMLSACEVTTALCSVLFSNGILLLNTTLTVLRHSR
jgi:hypothetical protein